MGGRRLRPGDLTMTLLLLIYAAVWVAIGWNARVVYEEWKDVWL